jgi:hypothetical protein
MEAGGPCVLSAQLGMAVVVVYLAMKQKAAASETHRRV